MIVNDVTAVLNANQRAPIWQPDFIGIQCERYIAEVFEDDLVIELSPEDIEELTAAVIITGMALNPFPKVEPATAA